MSVADIARVQGDLVAAAQRALEAGFEYLDLLFGHGMLAQSFFSPYSNYRADQYGGDFGNRARFLLGAIAAVRKVWPDRFPLSVRFGVIGYDSRDEGRLTEAIQLAQGRPVSTSPASVSAFPPPVPRSHGVLGSWRRGRARAV